jgi:hypothetical protein
MRSASGINELQSLNTSGVHAACCCGVPCDHAGAAKLEVRAKVAMAMRLLSSIVLSPDLIVVPFPTDRFLGTGGESGLSCSIRSLRLFGQYGSREFDVVARRGLQRRFASTSAFSQQNEEPPVCTENLSPDVVVMKSAEDWA